MRSLFIFLFLIVFVSVKAQTNNRFQTMLNSYYEDYLYLFPSVASSLGDNRYNNLLENPVSESHRQSTVKLYTRYLDSLKAFNIKNLTENNQLSYEILDYDLKNKLSLLKYPTNLNPINQMGDFRLSFSQLGGGTGNHPFKTVKDYGDFLQRITAFSSSLDTAIANMKIGIIYQRVQPRAVVLKVIPQLKAMIVESIVANHFYKPIINMPPSFSDADKKRLADSYTLAINNELMPAYKRLLSFIENEYLPQSRNTVSASALPGGAEEYAFLVKYYTSTNYTPDQVFNIGITEVKRIRRQMEKIKKETGFTGTLQTFFEFLFREKKFFPFATEQDVVAAYNGIYEKMKPYLTKQFNLVPKTAFEVRPVEKYRAATSAAHYMRGTLDGSRPGIFYFPVLDATTYPYWRMEDLFLHEAIPGHHYQISLQMEDEQLPLFRKTGSYGAYVEGWGLYAESLGVSLGLYTDPYQRMGQLYGEIHRAIRLVVDVGMHHKGWTREQAVQYSLDNEPTTEARAIQEVERYIAWPGQALSYKIGELKILSIRAKAEKILGKKFNVKAFHDEVLKDGAMPLQIFENKMNRWIARE